jgi:hypothetical protein
MAAAYFSHTINTEELPDPISLDKMDDGHPRGIITFYNGINSLTKQDNELTRYDLKSLLKMHESKGDFGMFDPLTRKPFDENQIKRLKWYRECMTKYPNITRDNIIDYKSIIKNWIDNPTEYNTDIFKYFITYDQLINYYNFDIIDTREKAMTYFAENPSIKYVIRKSSVKDTKYNQFFVLMKNNSGTYENYLFVHQQGYGIMNVDAERNASIEGVTFNRKIYYPSIGDMLIDLNIKFS